MYRTLMASLLGICARQTALERQDLSRTYLAHRDLESVVIIIIIIIIAIGAQHVGLHAVPQKQLIGTGKLAPPPPENRQKQQTPKSMGLSCRLCA